MTVKELIEKLQQVNQDRYVRIYHEDDFGNVVIDNEVIGIADNESWVFIDG